MNNKTRPVTRGWLRRAAASLPALVACAAQAGRPMVMDDATTARRGECQVELWGDRLEESRLQSIAPACGLTDSLELDLQATRIQGAAPHYAALALALKWVPEALIFELPGGRLSFGAKAGNLWSRDAAQHMRNEGPGGAALGTLALGPAWTFSASLWATRSLPADRTTTGFNLGAAWQIDTRWLVFAESLNAQDARSVTNLGVRLWLVPGVLGLDLSAARTAANGRALSLGLGWYQITLP